MNVLIKGMEMPKNCFLCPLSVLKGERLYCEVTKDEVLRAKKPSDCPLIELPPHGRLIDRDELIKFSHYDDHDICVVDMEDIRNAPTIIEAEPPKEG